MSQLEFLTWVCLHNVSKLLDNKESQIFRNFDAKYWPYQSWYFVQFNTPQNLSGFS